MDAFEVIDILLVEDSDADAELAMRALRRAGVMNHITRMRDGAEALQLLEKGAQSGSLPQLILLDLNMPGLGGIELIRLMKAKPAMSGIPIIVLTESAQARDIIDGYNLGINSYLIKPISAPAFNEVVTQVGLFWSVTRKLSC